MLLTHGMMKGECPINGLGVLLSFLEQIILEGKMFSRMPPNQRLYYRANIMDNFTSLHKNVVCHIFGQKTF